MLSLRPGSLTRLSVLALIGCLLAATLLSSDSSSANPSRRADRALDLDPSEDVTLQLGSSVAVFKRATLQNLSQAYIKLTGVDLNDDALIDDFAVINHCDLYQRYFRDEFSWRQARDAFRRVIQRELESYPENIYILGTLNLGRYDFERKAFILEDENRFDRTGQFRFYDRTFGCTGAVIKQLPLTYYFRLTNPISLDAIEVPEEKAFQITRLMEQEENLDRKVYITFYLRINDFTSQGVSGNTGIRTVTRATLMSMRLYLDRQRKIQIYEYSGLQ